LTAISKRTAVPSNDSSFSLFDFGGEVPRDSAYQLTLLSAADVDRVPGFRDEWERHCQSGSNLNALFQSPAWWDFIQPVDHGELCAVLVARAADGSLAGVVPVRTEPYTLSFRLGRLRFWTKRLKAVRVLGCQPNLRDDEDLYLAVVHRLFREFPDADCILMEAMAVESDCWKFVSGSQRLRELTSIYIRRGMTPHHVVAIPDSFDSYLGKFRSKTRYNLRRQVKRLQEHGGGRMELARVDEPEKVRAFLDDSAEIETHSWQHDAIGPTLDASPQYCEKLAHLANRGFVRSYILRCGDKPCAMVKGFQYGGVYYYSWCEFDQRLAEFSPGTVLLYLLIEDLCRHRSPKCLTFLWGDAAYKKVFGTNCIEDATALLIAPRARLFTKLYVRLHAAAKYLAARLRRPNRQTVDSSNSRDS
jgi:CelD/BcsL family acetyltransferase involved in cellulose biosynthesis